MKKFDFFIFTADFAKKTPKNDVTMGKNFDFLTTNIFLQLLAKFLAPYDHFWGTYAIFHFSPVLY